ncbi:MAG TPA: acyl-CoA dehydrogenase [Steroidobacteraceae bacterium]|nr:acyl-CoA dehydrogenase [Steroidobacteraceae bacterium]
MYRAPLKDIGFVLNELLGEHSPPARGGFPDYSPELGATILTEAARFAETVLEPLNKQGDREGAHWSATGVAAPAGFKEAYRQFVEGGWPQLGVSAAYGGQPVPQMLTTAVQEIWASANLAFKLCPMLTHGAAHALELTGSEAQRALYLPRMVSGQWTGTMVLTEPHAGSDLGLIRTRAVPDGDRYRLFGQKIFITWGEHDYTENIVHMVLARIEGAPGGTRGISLFIVPKVLVGPDGRLGERNDVRCVSIEHKLGIHASPTCVMAFGERDGAVGYLVGEPNRGLEYMFIMMNTARLAVGLEGYAVAERAFQQAADWARSRVQGAPLGVRGAPATTIVHHPDVKRMLLTMKGSVEAMRALTLYAAGALDLASHHPQPAQRSAAQLRADLLIPIVKGWCTELGIEAASLGIQVHGGMGFIEETGAAQFLRDVRITAIYEGTTGIQANDLIGRKIGRDGGAAMRALIAEMQAELEGLRRGAAAAAPVREAALEGIARLSAATEALIASAGAGPTRPAAVAVPYLELCGYSIAGWLVARAAEMAAARLASGELGQANGALEGPFYAAKLATARFYAEQLLPRTLALARIVERGSASVEETDPGLI